MEKNLNTESSEKGYGPFMKRTFDRPMVEHFQKTRTRRMLVLLMCTWFVSVNAIAFSFPSAIWVWGPLFLGFFPLASSINMSVRGITEIPLKQLDDRQATLKSRAYLNAYWVGICLAVLFGYAAAKIGFSAVHTMPFLGGGLGILVGLPAMLLAWRLPDETDNEA